MIERGVVGFLSVQVDELTQADQMSGPWDLVIATASWEQRANAAVPYLAALSEKVFIVHFKSSDPTIADVKKKFVENTLAALKAGEELPFPASNAAEQVFLALNKLFEDQFKKAGRALRVLIDISSLPKKYVLYLLGLGFKREYVARFTLLYAEAKYLPPSVGPATISNPAGFISDGEWTSVQVPFLEGSEYVPDKRDVVVTIGAEIGVAIPTIERLEPRKLTLIKVADPHGRVPVDLVKKEQKYVDALLAQPNSVLKEYGIDQVLQPARDILSNCEGATTCLAIGSKPHAIAVALAALADERVDVVCRTPSSYRHSDAIPTGRIIRFVVEDRFEPSTYLKD